MFKEVENKPLRYVYEAVLDNGDTIFVRPNGTADSSSGKKYIEITKTDNEGDIVHCGWIEEN